MFYFGKHISALALICSFHFSASAQSNLVPNGSFEIYSTCPTFGGLGEINKATPWFQPNYPYAGAGGSSDFFHFCDGITCASISQCPRTGNGVAGISPFKDSSAVERDHWREYIEVKLTDSMKSSETYCIRFYVALGDGVGYAIKNIQAVLTIDSLLYNDPNYGYIPGVNPALEADSVLTDTVNWTRVQMSYTAAGGEQFLTIGNFSPGDSTEFSILGVGYYSYYILDDFSVYKQPRCFAGNDTTILPGDSVQLGILGEYEPSYSWVPTIYLTDPNIANPIATPPSTITYTLTVTDTNQLACNPVQNDYITIWVSGVGIDENGNTTHSGELWPNPAENSCTYKLDLKQNQEAELFLNDLLGRTVQRHTLSGQKNRIEMNLSELDAGVYFIKVLIEGNLADSQKLIIQ